MTLDPLLLARATSAAAIAAQDWVGRLEKEQADHACVEALRTSLGMLPFKARVVIGEGEKDNAPALYKGEVLGSAEGEPTYDMAVDPLEGTRFCARGLANSFCVVALAKAGAMKDPGPSFYMDKIAVCAAAAKYISPEMSPKQMLKVIADKRGKSIKDIRVFILNRPRNKDKIDAVIAAGARVSLHEGGDVLAALSIALDEGNIDLSLGIGGSPEGYLGVAALKAAGCGFWGRFAPQSKAEQKATEDFGLDTACWYSAEELIAGDTLFAASGITDGALVQAPLFDGERWHSETLVFSKTHGLARVELAL